MNSNEVRRYWEERSGEYSPEYYAYKGPDRRSEAVRAHLVEFVGRDAAVLELGCSSGRHLAHLADDGFEDLAGIEVNADAFEVMAETYPDLAAAGTFYDDAIESVVGDLETDRFDAVFSVETLQHVHPDAEWVFGELVRIADDLVLTVENERGVDGEGTSAPSHAESAGTDDPDGTDGDGPAVNYVREDLPLFFRDWADVFTGLGCEQVAAERGERDVLRAFRPA